jgi:hypothetical protein
VEKLKKDNADSTESFYLQNTAFGHVFAQLQHVDPSLYRQRKPQGQGSPHHSLTVNFEGELVEGLTGPYRQFFTDCSKGMLKRMEWDWRVALPSIQLFVVLFFLAL